MTYAVTSSHRSSRPVRNVLFLLGVGACLSCRNPVAPATENADVVVTVNPSQTFQTIEGFGNSMRMFTDPHIIGLPQESAENALQIPLSSQAEILDSLYRGIGLTRVRVATETSGIEPVNDNNDPAVTDLSKFDFSGRHNDAFLDVVRDLKTHGVTRWWISPIALESWMDETNPQEYVEWAMAINRQWKEHGLELSYYSLRNEPSGATNPLSNGDYMREVVKLLGRALKAEGFSTKIVIPDDVRPSTAAALASTVLADPEARQYVGAIAFHLYNEPVSQAAPLRDMSAQYKIPLWMSEYYVADWMEWATLVHTLLADYNVSAIDYLAGFLGNDSGAALVALQHDGTTYQGYRMLDQYYAFGNYTKYVRPGAVRVAASSSAQDVNVSAFVQSDRLTLVAINHRDTAVTVRFNVGTTNNRQFSVVTTSAQDHLAPLPALDVTSGSIVTVLKPASVTTIYQ
jgi:O-glycosyl hydrolase